MINKRKILGSYPFISVLFSISMALFVIGVFGTLVIYANKLSGIIRENIEMHVYLDQSLSEDERMNLLKSFYGKEYVAMKSGKKQVFFISKEDAADKFIKETGEEFIKFLGDNPLRDAYVVKINPEYSSKRKLRRVKNELELIDGVFEVVYVETLIDSINENIRKITLILLGFAMILSFVVYILINSSIRLALYSQRFLIRSMQLVGATAFFIQKPFLGRAFLHGVLGGVIASVLLFIMMQYAVSQIPELQYLESPDHTILLMCGLILGGGLLGLISSFVSINKYLRMSLNELY